MINSKTLSAVLLSSAFILAAPISKADDCVVQGTTLSPDQITKSVQDLGYTVNKDQFFTNPVKLNDQCTYRVDATDASGKDWELYVDPTTGKLLGKKED